jgi:hypothetical protein
MSMYSELLTVLYDRIDPYDLTDPQGELTEILVQCRRRLHRGATDPSHPIADRLALELDHDRTLLWLCAVMAVDHDPGRFTDRESERRHLEGALARSGVDLNDLAYAPCPPTG